MRRATSEWVAHGCDLERRLTIARDWPWGMGDNDNYQQECCECKKPYRGHKRSIVCCKCQRESDERWAAMTVEERIAHMRHVESEMAKFWAENDKDLARRALDSE
jgi:hypothetical protein